MSTFLSGVRRGKPRFVLLLKRHFDVWAFITLRLASIARKPVTRYKALLHLCGGFSDRSVLQSFLGIIIPA